jgi:hypothetical protein
VPIHIDVFVNNKPIKSYHIGRTQGDTNPDSVNEYVLMETAYDDDPLVWDYSKKFGHRYGDGIDVCIRKGLELPTKDSQEQCDHSEGGLIPNGEGELSVVEFTYCPKCGEKL